MDVHNIGASGLCVPSKRPLEGVVGVHVHACHTLERVLASHGRLAIWHECGDSAHQPRDRHIGRIAQQRLDVTHTLPIMRVLPRHFFFSIRVLVHRRPGSSMPRDRVRRRTRTAHAPWQTTARTPTTSRQPSTSSRACAAVHRGQRARTVTYTGGLDPVWNAADAHTRSSPRRTRVSGTRRAWMARTAPRPRKGCRKGSLDGSPV